MRRLGLIAVVLAALATPAAAQQPQKIVVPTPPAAPKIGPTKPVSPLKPVVPSPSAARSATAAPQTAAVCTQTCARSYYFCQATGSDCGPSWAQCRARCVQPGAASSATPLPR